MKPIKAANKALPADQLNRKHSRKHSRDPGPNLVIGRNSFKFVLVAFEKCGRHRRQPRTKPRLKEKERIYLAQEFWWDACHHPSRWFYEQMALREGGNLGGCIEVP